MSDVSDENAIRMLPWNSSFIDTAWHRYLSFYLFVCLSLVDVLSIVGRFVSYIRIVLLDIKGGVRNISQLFCGHGQMDSASFLAQMKKKQQVLRKTKPVGPVTRTVGRLIWSIKGAGCSLSRPTRWRRAYVKTWRHLQNRITGST